MRKVAFIPARSGSKRILHKNIHLLGGHPLLAYSVQAAVKSGVFDAVICATDSQEYADIAVHYGATVPFLRAPAISGSKSPDIDWITWMLRSLSKDGHDFEVFAILRPTSPFRLETTIRRAWDLFSASPDADSLRAVQKCKQHPGKMWKIDGEFMTPLLAGHIDGTPWHSSQYAALPSIYVQDASLEISRARNVLEGQSISGTKIVPFVSESMEGFDINEPEDLILAAHFLATSEARLTEIEIVPFGS